MTQEMKEIQEWLDMRDAGFITFKANFLNDGKSVDIEVNSRENFIVERCTERHIVNGHGDGITWSRSDLWYVIVDGSLLIKKGFKCYKRAIKEGIDKHKIDLVKSIAALPVV